MKAISMVFILFGIGLITLAGLYASEGGDPWAALALVGVGMVSMGIGVAREGRP